MIKHGEKISTDGEVVEGRSSVNKAMLTGYDMHPLKFKLLKR